MESVDSKPSRKRQSLRDSVLQQPRNRLPSHKPADDEGREYSSMKPGRGFFNGMGNFFGNSDSDDIVSPFGFGTFGNLDRLDELMSKFISDFRPESFADSQYYREDRDLDEDIGRRGLDQALEVTPESHNSKSFYGFSHSVSTITRPDGSIEKRVTHRNANGDTTTEVTITSPDGRKEVIRGGCEDNFHDVPMSGSDARLVPPNHHHGSLFQSVLENIKRFF